MKRMTLLTALALVFSLFTVTAAIASSGLGTGDSEQSGALDRIQAKAEPNEAACQGDDCPVSDMARTQGQAKDGADECQAEECPAGDAAKEQTKEQAKEQTKTKEMLKAQSGECLADDCPADEALMVQVRERVMTKLIAMLGAEDAEVAAQYRLFSDNMWQKMLGLRVLFL